MGYFCVCRKITNYRCDSGFVLRFSFLRLCFELCLSGDGRNIAIVVVALPGPRDNEYDGHSRTYIASVIKMAAETAFICSFFGAQQCTSNGYKLLRKSYSFTDTKSSTQSSRAQFLVVVECLHWNCTFNTTLFYGHHIDSVDHRNAYVL